MEKLCPTCHRRYVEEDLNYCLVDGSLLLKADEISPGGAPTVKTTAAPTEVMPPGQLGVPTEVLADSETITSPGKLSYPQPRPFLSTRNIIALAVAGLVLAGLVLFTGSLLKTFLTSTSSANVNSSANNNAAKTNKPAASPNPTTSPQALEGTIWSGTNSRGEKSEFYFLSSGRLRYRWKDKFYDKASDRWSQTGDAVTMNLSDGALKYSGVIKGEQIDFDVSNEAGSKWKLSLRRVK